MARERPTIIQTLAVGCNQYLTIAVIVPFLEGIEIFTCKCIFLNRILELYCEHFLILFRIHIPQMYSVLSWYSEYEVFC